MRARNIHMLDLLMKHIFAMKGLVFILALLAINTVSAQSFSASTNARQVVKDGYFSLTYTFENITGGDFKTPDLKKDFIQVRQPARSVSTTMVNNTVTRIEKITYQLKPRRVGRFTIGPASLTVGGKRMTTNPITIEVVASAVDSDDALEVFIKAEPGTTEAFIGQQIYLDYKLYTKVDVERSSILEESEYDGFFVQEIRRYNGQAMQEIIDGVQYTTKVIRRVVLFPQQTGTLEVTPFSLQLGIATDSKSGSRSFFFNRDIRQVPISSNSVTINVSPLPDGAPENFTGAIGEYQQIISLNRRTLTTDDALTLNVSIVGNGDIKRVQVPKYVFPESFEMYAPKVLEEVTYETNGGTMGKKVFEFLVVPTQVGVFTFEPAFSYFSPDSLKYITIKGEPYQINVRKGSKGKVFLDPNAEEIQSEIDFLKLDTRLYPRKAPFYNSTSFWGLVLLPFIALGGFVTYKRWKEQKSDIDPGILRSKKAKKIAEQRLQVAAKYLKEQESRSFYDEISKAFLGYVCDKLHIPRSALSKDGLKEKLQELNVAPELIDTILEIIKTSEVALFAGQDNREAMQGIYDKSLSTLADMEESLG
jgi:hypothetical protein